MEINRIIFPLASKSDILVLAHCADRTQREWKTFKGVVAETWLWECVGDDKYLWRYGLWSELSDNGVRSVKLGRSRKKYASSVVNWVTPLTFYPCLWARTRILYKPGITLTLSKRRQWKNEMLRISSVECGSKVSVSCTRFCHISDAWAMQRNNIYRS